MDLDKKLQNLLLEIDIIQGRAYRVKILGQEDMIIYTNSSDHLIFKDLGLPKQPPSLDSKEDAHVPRFLSKLKKKICTIFR